MPRPGVAIRAPGTFSLVERWWQVYASRAGLTSEMDWAPWERQRFRPRHAPNAATNLNLLCVSVVAASFNANHPNLEARRLNLTCQSI